MSHRILVTGATGFLGSEIVRQLHARGAPLATTGRRKGAPLPGYRFCDLTKVDDLDSLVDGVHCIVHSAGLAHQFDAGDDADERFLEINVSATEKLAHAATRASVGHFVHISSVSVYGGRESGARTEDSACHPEGAYARSKYEAERRLIAVARHSGMRLTILRLATIYGEGDPGNVGRLMRAMDRGRFIRIGSGENNKTLIHREDAAKAVLLAAERPATPRVAVYNIAAPPVSMREFTGTMATALGKKIPNFPVPQFLIRPPLELASLLLPRNSRLARFAATIDKFLRNESIDGGKFARSFDFAPSVDLSGGLSREVRWYRSNHNAFAEKEAHNAGAPSSR